MPPGDAPFVTVVTSTRDRGGLVAETVRSLLRNDYPRFEVCVIDQSDDERTQTALEPLLGDGRLSYTRSETRGISVGRNIGSSRARGEIVAFTDDDCLPSERFVAELSSAFELDKRVGMVFGNVLEDSGGGDAGASVLAYERTEPCMARSIRDKHKIQGVGGCMGIRRNVWKKVGGFDVMLGLGAPLQSTEEEDMAIRVLLAGYFIFETPRVTVTHRSILTPEESHTRIRQYLYGQGAMAAKYLKTGRWSTIRLVFHMGVQWLGGRSPVRMGDRYHSRLRRN